MPIAVHWSLLDRPDIRILKSAHDVSPQFREVVCQTAERGLTPSRYLYVDDASVIVRALLGRAQVAGRDAQSYRGIR